MVVPSIGSQMRSSFDGGIAGGGGESAFTAGSILGVFMVIIALSAGEKMSCSSAALYVLVVVPLWMILLLLRRHGRRVDAVEEFVRHLGGVTVGLPQMFVDGGRCASGGSKLMSTYTQCHGVEGNDNGGDGGIVEFTDEEEGGGGESLERKVKRERKRRNEAVAELEKERIAAAAAAAEAMAKIQQLQNEKALVAREARQYREMAEQRQEYDRQVIESLQCAVDALRALAFVGAGPEEVTTAAAAALPMPSS